jgi:hypothetical protein
MRKLKQWWWRHRFPAVDRAFNEFSLEQLETCIAEVRTSEPKNRAIALDGLAYVAGEVMDASAKEWEQLVGRKWERYTD